MSPLSLVTDNITELLVKIIEFTESRQKILIGNVKGIHSLDFVPEDLAVDEFSSVLAYAVNEHAQNQRLVLYDTENIKFGHGGSFETKATVDEYARELLETDKDEYLELQIGKLLENSLNQRIAAEMLRQRQETLLIIE
jgi:flagellar basal body rod protein FlgB